MYLCSFSCFRISPNWVSKCEERERAISVAFEIVYLYTFYGYTWTGKFIAMIMMNESMFIVKWIESLMFRSIMTTCALTFRSQDQKLFYSIFCFPCVSLFSLPLGEVIWSSQFSANPRSTPRRSILKRFAQLMKFFSFCLLACPLHQISFKTIQYQFTSEYWNRLRYGCVEEAVVTRFGMPLSTCAFFRIVFQKFRYLLQSTYVRLNCRRRPHYNQRPPTTQRENERETAKRK